jgi:HNH endonuclease
VGGATVIWCAAEIGLLAAAATTTTTVVLEHRTVTNGGRPSKATKDEVDAENQEKNGGVQKCDYCGVEVDQKAGSPRSKEYDHKTSLVNGGKSDATNICISCRTDNRRKGPKNAEDYKPTVLPLVMQGLLTPTRAP